MKNKVLHLDNFTESLASICNYKYKESDKKDNNYKKMVSSLKNVLVGELTKRQKECILLHYGENMKMIDIARELNIGVSSVSRHIKVAKLKIIKIMNYYF